MAKFDEKCPYCNADMRCQENWEHESEYRRDCESCGRMVQIFVHMVPEFETAKPKCQRCRRVEITEGWYCPECAAELRALSEFNEVRYGKLK